MYYVSYCHSLINSRVKTVSFDAKNQHLVTGSNEKLIRVFDLNESPANESSEIYKGHSGNINRALFFRNDKCIVSCAEDKTISKFIPLDLFYDWKFDCWFLIAIGVWDRSSGLEVQHIDFDTTVNSIELSRDGNVLTVTNGFNVSFFETETLKKLKEITVPTRLSSASLHPDKMVFVCGGEDFKMYKYDYLTGNEIGK